MSDQETQDGKDTPEDTREDTPKDSAPAEAAPKAAPEPAPRKGSSGPAWFALLLVIVLAAAAAWVVMEGQRREGVLVKRIAELETAADTKDDGLETATASLEAALKSGIDGLAESVNGKTGRLSSQLQAVEADLAGQKAALERFNASDRDSWLLAEAEYLLRLANQRLIMAGDVESAQALLKSADEVLRELDDTTLHDVRSAVANDLAAVRAVPKVDVEGIYLRLGALSEQAGQLVIFQLPELDEMPREAPAEQWQDRLRQGYEAALAKLSDYIIIRRRDVQMQTLMDPQFEGLVRQNLRMLLEQSQVALLSGNQTLYSESLERAQHWVAEFLASDEANATAIAREITQLSGLTIAVDLPDISRSLHALDAAIERRLEQGGGE